MGGITEYLLSVTAAAIISCCITAIIGKNSSGHQLVKMLCGIFVAVTVLKPITDLQFSLPGSLDSLIPVEAEAYIEEGQQSAAQAQMEIIKQQTEAYILEKAASLNCELQVHVELSDESPYEPVKAELIGAVSPFAKRQLSNWLEQSLNISAEGQTWSG